MKRQLIVSVGQECRVVEDVGCLWLKELRSKCQLELSHLKATPVLHPVAWFDRVLAWYSDQIWAGGMGWGSRGREHPKYGCHSLVITTEVTSHQLMKIVNKASAPHKGSALDVNAQRPQGPWRQSRASPSPLLLCTCIEKALCAHSSKDNAMALSTALELGHSLLVSS